MSNAHFLPVSRHSVVPRSRIVARALDGDPALIALVGRPGSGKTVTAVQLATEFADRGEQVVWIRLTADDSEHRSFWQRCFGVLAQAGVAPEGSQALRLFSEGPRISEPESVAEALEECSQPLAVVVDDAHHLDAGHADEVATSVLHALERVPGLRVIVTSRRPFVQLTGVDARVRVPVVELLEEDLAFSEPEVEQLLAARLPHLGQARRKALADSVMGESAGWPIAAHAAITERDLDRPGRPTAARGSYIRGYVDRMLDGCTEQEREALMVSGVVPEVSARVLAAMLGLSVERAESLLDGSPSVDLASWEEEGERWYRHHDLVREELAARSEREVAADRLQACHRGAAAALAETRPFEAVRSAMRARAWEWLAEMLLDSYMLMIEPRPRVRLSPWLRDIPEDVRQQYPVLAAFALIDEHAAPAGRQEKVRRDLEELAEQTLAEASAGPGLPGATATVLRMVAARLSGNEALALAMAEQAQEVFDQLDEAAARRYRGAVALAATQRPLTFLHADRFEEAERALRLVEATSDESDGHSRAATTALAAFGSALRGDIPQARDLVARCGKIDTRVGWHDGTSGTVYRIAAAIVALDDGDAETAEAQIAALDDGRDLTDHWPYVVVVGTLARDFRAGPEEALAHLDRQTARWQGQAVLPTAQDRFARIRARLGWHAGHVVPRVRGGLPESVESVYHAFGWHDPTTARAIVGRLLQGPHIAENPRDRAELLLLKAEAALQGDDEQTAAAAARQAAEVLDAHQLGLPLRALPRASLEQLRKFAPSLRAELGATRVGVTFSPLSLGEQRTITAIALYGNVADAAKALFRSPNTVKTQLRAAYRKLGTNQREEALRIAGDAGLIDETLLHGDAQDD
ncbi:MAG: AAA family ATPase [Aeromicrobium sp.]|uniref:AAA family ATPase n=1 Tax=Aeromicrobium sp. TaxID=1871063 RepID=UPI0039E25415